MKELLFMTPVFKEMIWGGNKLREEYGYPIPSEKTGECWAISAHPNGESSVTGGTFAGKTLSTLWQEHPELFGSRPGRRGEAFPLLVKIIDAKGDLSIQVHPDDLYAGEHEHGSLGKTECWYILDSKDEGTIVIGHHAKNKAELKAMIEEKRFKDLIREVPVKKGDFFQINPGCVHAIKGGTLLLEVQQSSDITYRVYDYDRLSDGKPRPLHLQQSIEVIRVPFEEPAETGRRVTRQPEVTGEHLVTCPYYTVEKYDVHGTWVHQFPGAFINVSILDGEGSIDGTPVGKGQHLIIPFGYGECKFQGNFTMICAWPENG